MSFVEVESPGTKTKRWQVRSNDRRETILGVIAWFASWRKYTFQSSINYSVFDERCLREIADFIETKTKEHKLQ